MQNEKDELISVELDNNLVRSIESPTFNQILEDTPKLVERGKAILNSADPREIDDDELSNVQEDMSYVKNYSKNIEAALKSIRKVYDTARDAKVEEYRERLNNAGYEELTSISTQMKIFGQNVLNIRKEDRWKELKEEFDLTVSQYPQLKENLNDGLNFNRFKDSHEKLVTGAKSWRFNDKIKAEIHNYVDEIYKNLTAILNMKSEYNGKLIQHFDTTLDLPSTIALETTLKQQHAAAIKAQEDEIKRRAEAIAKQKIEEEQKRLKAQALAEAQLKAKEQLAKQTANKVLQPKTEQGIASSPFGMSDPEIVNLQKLNKLYPNLLSLNPDIKSTELTDIMGANLITRLYQDVFVKQDKAVLTEFSNFKEVLNANQVILNHTNF